MFKQIRLFELKTTFFRKKYKSESEIPKKMNLALFFVNKFLFQVNKIICKEWCGAINVKLFRNVLEKNTIFRIEDNNSNFVLHHNQLEIMR